MTPPVICLRSTPSREHLAPGQLIRVIRREQGVTLEQLGQKTGYSAAQLSRLERGISPMTVDAFRAFADALDIPSGPCNCIWSQPRTASGTQHGHWPQHTPSTPPRCPPPSDALACIRTSPTPTTDGGAETRASPAFWRPNAVPRKRSMHAPPSKPSSPACCSPDVRHRISAASPLASVLSEPDRPAKLLSFRS
ncbi:helix-turn-helix transcriptional regulator [Streptomyces sp. NPDC007083]|uniref:helix-turn-helix domain-containing protein n=1 Tax=Streptomyces sp. NPDC007083 TaxID=3156913 RepID=UPI0033FEF5C2